MKSGYLVRPFRESDGEQVRNLHVAAILATRHVAYSQEDLNSWAIGLTAGGYVEAVSGGETIEVVEFREGAVVAFCSRTFEAVQGLYVHPQHQRQGIAGELLMRAEAALRSAGVAVSVIDASVSAEDFYIGQGYAVIRRNQRESRGGRMIATADLEKRLA